MSCGHPESAVRVKQRMRAGRSAPYRHCRMCENERKKLGRYVRDVWRTLAVKAWR